MNACKSAFMFLSVIFSLAVAGCATTDQKLSQQYQPIVNATGGSGELLLAVTDEKSKVRNRRGKPTAHKGAIEKWVVMTMKNDSGKKLGIMVSLLTSDDLLRDAFRQELSAAGYTVRLVKTLPKDVNKGIDLSRVSVDAEQVNGLFQVEGTCKVSIGFGLWRNGIRVKNLDYDVSYSEFAVKDRDRLLQATLQKALQDVMKQAIPDVINTLGH